MSRRPSLPGAAELFRVTGGPAIAPAVPAVPAPTEQPDTGRAQPRPAPVRQVATSVPEPGGSRPAGSAPTGSPAAGPSPVYSVPDTRSEPDELDEAGPRRPGSVRQTGSRRRIRAVGDRRPSGRQRHEEKITVYCSAEELLDLEQARLALRADHGLAVDRGRIVREAVAVVLADLEAKGETSIIVRRLRES
jgi:hypothetical protein